MAARDGYRAQVNLLIRCLPALASAPDFALKGGTAINLFLQDIPRLSVDLDLTYLPLSDRETALADIGVQLATIAEALRRTLPDVNVQLTGGDSPKLLVDRSGARIKAEPSVVIRGSLFPPVLCELCPAAQRSHETFVEVLCLDPADLYAGKLCAALDRQHPRDLFDVMTLQAAGPIPGAVRQALVAYIAGHRRPIAELLRPNLKPIGDLFANHFVGMTGEPVELAALETTRTQLFQWVATALNENERRFLLSIKQGEPDWPLLTVTLLIGHQLASLVQQLAARICRASGISADVRQCQLCHFVGNVGAFLRPYAKRGSEPGHHETKSFSEPLPEQSGTPDTAHRHRACAHKKSEVAPRDQLQMLHRRTGVARTPRVAQGRPRACAVPWAP